MIIALPLTLSYKVTRIINFVHINFITVGAYAGVILFLLGANSLLVVIPVSFILGASIAVLNHFIAFSPLERRGANPVIQMIASLGLWIFYKYLTYALLDIGQRVFRTNLFSVIPRATSLPAIVLGQYVISGHFFTALLVAGAMIAILYLLLTKTAIGRAIRAVSDNPTLAEISGIPKDRVVSITWALCGGMAAIGGLLWAVFAIATPEVGDALILQIFAVSVLGGLESLFWTSIGAFVISGAENLLMSILNAILGVPVSFRPFISFSALLLIILVRPPLGAGGGLPYRFRLPVRSRLQSSNR
jgi:branched-subunit amino acid ABC-type transport system permease component